MQGMPKNPWPNYCPKQAQVVLEGDLIEERPVAELKVGDIVRVQAGENVPADGVILRGDSRINESLLTGESKPVEKNEGDLVIGGSTNGSGVLFVKVSQTGDASFLSQVQNLVAEAQNQPSRGKTGPNALQAGYFILPSLLP